jgi:hypothetical protein
MPGLGALGVADRDRPATGLLLLTVSVLYCRAERWQRHRGGRECRTGLAGDPIEPRQKWQRAREITGVNGRSGLSWTTDVM